MKTETRAFFETVLLPTFATRFLSTDRVLNLGAGKHSYREAFPCRVVTADKMPGCDATFAAEAIPFSDGHFDGVLLMGVFERLDDPMLAIREIYRVLRPSGALLISLLDLGCPWRKACDRWRVSPGGVAHILSAFDVIEEYAIEDQARFVVAQKPIGGVR